MTSSRSRSRTLLFSFAAILLLFLIVELLLRAVVTISAGYLSQRQDLTYEYKLWQMHLFDSFMGMHEPDPQLFWRLKPNYQSSFVSVDSDGFVGPEIAPKQANEYRILFLGDSTPFGLGLPDANQSFVRQLEGLLQAQHPERRITVINASVAGYSSWQCRKLLELKGEQLHPDLVITYFGNNDPSINGYLTDSELYTQTSRSGWLNRALAYSYLYQLLKDVVLKLKPVAQSEDADLTARVPLEQAAQNLDYISDWCSGNGVRLLICTVATPDLWPPGIQFKIFAGGRDQSGRLVMAAEMQQDLEASWALCLDTLLLPGQSDEWTRRVYQTAYRDLGDPARVAKLYQDQLQQSPGDPRLLNNLAVALWYAGEFPDSLLALATAISPTNPVPFYNRGVVNYRRDREQAELYLDSARELDDYSLRIKSGYNDLYRSFSETRSLALADVESLLRGRVEATFFVDHCHPSKLGHDLIARYLAGVVAEQLMATK